jgi:hypothetical protein
VASALLLVSWFNAIATTTLCGPPAQTPGPIIAVTDRDQAWTRSHAASDYSPCFMFITPSPYPGQSPCEGYP